MKQVISFSFSSDLINLINSIPKNERSKKIESILLLNLNNQPDQLSQILSLLHKILFILTQKPVNSSQSLPISLPNTPISADKSPFLPNNPSNTSNSPISSLKHKSVGKPTYTFIPK
jgi:hypothetical protein